jgi:hypothetical protein
MRIGFALVLVTACYAPQPSPGAPCPDKICPTGLVCSPASHTCERLAIDAGSTIDTSPVVDALVDGPPDAYVPPMPLLRQQAVSYANQAASLSVTFATAPTSGNVLITIGGTPTAPLTSVTGGGVATWQLAKRSTVQSNVEIWWGITDGSSSVVTVSLTGNNSPTWLHVAEWSELTGVVDAATALDGGTSPASAGTLTTPTRDLLVFGFSQFTPTTIGNLSPGSWTAMTPIDGNFVKQREWYRIESTPGTYSPSVTVSNAGWDAALVAFRIGL